MTNTAFGQQETWADVLTVWGRMSEASISSRAAFQQAHNKAITHRLTLRGTPELSMQNHRVVWRNRVYEIVTPPHNVAGIGGQTMIDVSQVQEAVS